MIRPIWFALMLGSFIAIGAHKSAAAQSINVPLIAQERAQQIGLQRAWVTQVPLDRARSKITHIKLQAGLLLVVTSEHMLYVIDPESGQIQWSFLIGDRKLMSLSPAANATYVAVANTARLFLLNRATGDVVMDHEATGTPERGPVLTAQKVILPLVNGPLQVYPRDDFVLLSELTDPKNTLSPAYYASAGRMFGDPATSDDLLIWAGDQNRISAHLFAEQPVDFNKLVPETLSTAPSLFAPNVYLGTELGYLIAYDVDHFNEAWRFSAGSPIHRRPIAIGSAVFVLPEEGGMFAVDPKTGEMLWFAPDPVQFVAASPQRIYTLDSFGRLTMLNAKTGARTNAVSLPYSLKMLTNDQSDRLVFYTDQGLIQSLHETTLTQPVLYSPPKKQEPTKKGAGGSSKPATAAADAKSDKTAPADAKSDKAPPAAKP